MPAIYATDDFTSIETSCPTEPEPFGSTTCYKSHVFFSGHSLIRLDISGMDCTTALFQTMNYISLRIADM